MEKCFVLLAGFVVMTLAQRSPYAGNPDRSYPQVLPQYRLSVSNEINTSPGIVERFGENSENSSPPKYDSYDPYNDEELIARIKTWPREKQPFWYLNREAIAAQRGGPSSMRRSGSTTIIPRGRTTRRLKKRSS